ncbi:MAG: hypothetical protein HYX25_06520 [Candidatus Solibacter usitatus]|nr:hypothetical protein [Candidatus Solibacter usitatus]
MKPAAIRIKFGLVAAGYAAVIVVAAALLYRRHVLDLQDPVAASGGMAAAGDMMLHLFIGFLFLIPTVFLIGIMAKFEGMYTAYSKFLFGLSLSAPVCMGVAFLGEKYVAQSLSWICFFRVLESPVILAGMAVSRIAARFARAKRLISYALLVEGLALAVPVAAFAVALVIRR